MISKLDALSIILTLSTLFLISHISRRNHLLSSRTIVRDMALFGGIPALAWIAFAYFIFGSPIPQSFYAKMYYHRHASGGWFPFLRGFEHQLLLVQIFMLTCLFSGIFLLFRRKISYLCKYLPFGLAMAAYTGSYLYYNPDEQMTWYYVVPEYLMHLQILVLLLLLLRRWPHSATRNGLLLLGIYTVVFLPNTRREVKRCLLYLNRAEVERREVGRWVHRHSDADDRLFTQHGYIAREAGRYAYDGSGLNSRITTEYRLDHSRMLIDLRPEWVVSHGLLPLRLQASLGYRLVKSFYNISGYGYPSWRVFRRSPATPERISIPVPRKMITTEGSIYSNRGALVIVATQFTVQIPAHLRPVSFTV
ncbi:hypothetical protein D6779_05125, partial [Candidatus Parcubacteria bacterium]